MMIMIKRQFSTDVMFLRTMNVLFANEKGGNKAIKPHNFQTKAANRKLYSRMIASTCSRRLFLSRLTSSFSHSPPPISSTITNRPHKSSMTNSELKRWLQILRSEENCFCCRKSSLQQYKANETAQERYGY
jgi:hypothetical protein